MTRLLIAVADGDDAALHQLWDNVQDELRAIARGKLRREHDPQALESAFLVNEAFTRLFGKPPKQYANRKHFYCYAARVMAHLIVDHVRARRPHVRLEQIPPIIGMPPTELLALNECLERLERINQRAADVVRLRFFTRRTVEETAEHLGVSPRTVESDWQFARAWLHRCLKKGDTTTGGAAKAVGTGPKDAGPNEQRAAKRAQI